jgi:hypothetical protein
MKANNALPFVRAMTYCEVVDRFSFALVTEDAEGGSTEESAYSEATTSQYIAAVDATLDAMRRVARGEVAAASPAT